MVLDRTLPAVALASLLLGMAAAADVTAGAWSTPSDVLSPREKLASACLVSGSTFSMYVFGGRDAKHRAGYDDMYQYDSGTQAWRQVYTAGDVPGAYATALGVLPTSGDMLLFGGVQDGQLSSRAFRLSNATKMWSELLPPAGSPTPLRRYRMASWVVDARYLVSFGGASELDLLNDVWALDTQTGVWELWHDGSSSAAPSPRIDPCCSAIPNTNDTLCFGGTDADGDRNDYWRFFNKNRTWADVTAAGELPTARRLAHCGFVNDNEFVVWGGWDSNVGDFVGGVALSMFRPGHGVIGTMRTVTQALAPLARDSGTMCAAGGHAHLVGGAIDSGLTNEHLQVANDVLQVVAPLTARPEQRAGHCAVTVGSDIFILFGNNRDGFKNDVWRFETTATPHFAWTRAILETAANAQTSAGPSPRSEACAAARGTVIFVYGGVAPNGGMLSDLWAFNTQTYAWALQNTTGLSPGPRAAHGCAFVANRLIVGMGFGGRATWSDEWFSYDLMYQQWSAMAPLGEGERPAARRSFAIQPINATHFHVGLGIGKVTFSDWFVMGFQQQQGRLRPVFTKTKLAMPSGHAARRYARGEAATAGAGSRVIVCGGAISTDFPVAVPHACYQYDAGNGTAANGTGTVFPMGAASVMPVSVSGATATYLGSKYYVFGGQLSAANVKRAQYVSALQVFAFAAPAMCAEGDANDRLCLHCSPGSTNPGCALVAAGGFSHAAYLAPTQCGPGHSQWRTGGTSAAYCTKCPAGRYAALNGSTVCAACTKPSTCPVGSTRNGVTGGAHTRTLADVRQPAPLGSLDRPFLISLLVGLGILVITVGTALLTTFNIVNLRTWDRYSGEHTGLADDDGPVLKVQTYSGGFFSLTAYCAVLILLSLLALDFFYNGLEETKSDVPLPVLQSMFENTTVQNDMMFVATIHGPTRQVVEGDGAAVGISAACFTDATAAKGAADQCVGTAKWSTSDRYALPRAADPFVARCSVVRRGAEELCRMEVHVTGVTLHRGETAALEFAFSPALSAEAIHTEVVTNTGILKREVGNYGYVKLFGDEEHASAHDIDIVASPNTVFSGYPASTVSLQMTPTYYSTPKSLLRWPSEWSTRETVSATGYHTTASALPVRGNAINHLLFDQYFGVPVVFELFAGDASLLVTRTYRQSGVEILAEMLGAVTGMFGVFLYLTRLVDKYKMKRHGKHYAKLQKGIQDKKDKADKHDGRMSFMAKLDGFPFCFVKQHDDDEPTYWDAAVPDAAVPAAPATADQSAPAAGDRSPSPLAPVTNNDPHDDGAEVPLQIDQTCVEVPRSVSRSATVTPEKLLEPEAFARA
jgi:hypothetical protein